MHQLSFSSEGDWDGFDLVGLKGCLDSVSNHFEILAQSGTQRHLFIKRDPVRAPMVDFGLSPSGQFVIRLNCPDLHWANFAYQFTHELCHVVTNYRAENRQAWFDEVICELASIATLRLMAKSWRVCPPFRIGHHMLPICNRMWIK